MIASTVQGKVAYVTGAGRGIGLAIVEELLQQGARVVACVRRQASVDELRTRFATYDKHLWVTVCDVSRYEAVTTMVEAGIDRFGALDILVNNAGVIGPIAPLAEADPGVWADNIAINLVGVLHGCRAVLPQMLQHRTGVIINLSSGAADRPLEGWSAYCAAKAGVAMLTRSLALELADSGVRVYGLRPGVVDTDMQVQIRASGINEVSRLRREDLADPRDPARAIAWLCSEEAHDLVGQDLDIRNAQLRRRIGLERS